MRWSRLRQWAISLPAALLAALVFLLLWAKGLYVARFGGVSSVPRPLHAAELQALRSELTSVSELLTSALDAGAARAQLELS